LAAVNNLFTFMDVLTPQEIIEQVKVLTGDKFDSDLAKRLGVDKQSFPQYKNRKTVDLQQKIICLLLSKLNQNNSNP
jgi:hypothetical protein